MPRATIRRPFTRVNAPQRRVVWSGLVVSVRVPEDARPGSFPFAPPLEGEGRYVSYKQYVGGGVVHIFVHDDEPLQYRGQRVIALASVIEKTLADGREFLHVNLETMKGARPTHRFAVVPTLHVVQEPGFEVFKTPEPLRGAIVFAPLGSKIHRWQ